MFLIPLAIVGPLNTEPVSVCRACQHLQNLLWFAEPVSVCRACCGLQSLSVFAESAWSQRLLLFTEIASFVPPGSPYPLHNGGSLSSLFLPLLPSFTPLAAVSPRIDHLPKAPPPSTITLGLGLQSVDFEGHTLITHGAPLRVSRFPPPSLVVGLTTHCSSPKRCVHSFCFLPLLYWYDTSIEHVSFCNIK